MQGRALHTPLTRAGFEQADEIGIALHAAFGARPPLRLWASSAGRALQTLAIVAEHLDLDWHEAQIDARLDEMDMGAWGGRSYQDIHDSEGPFVDRRSGLFTRRPPSGEWYDDVALRLSHWLGDRAGDVCDRIVIMHGISSRVLRGLLTGRAPRPECGAPVAPSLPQGSIVRIADGVETLLHRGAGGFGASRPLTV